MKERKFNIFEKFVPSSDVDGLDIKPEYLSYISNMRIRDGFVESTPGFIPQSLSPNALSLVNLGYSIEAITYFYHSKQGYTSVVILWNENVDEVDRVKILVNDEPMVMPSNYLGDLRCLTKPKNVNFSLINDELKINVNCKGRFGAPGVNGEEFIVNFNLTWLEEVKFTGGEDTSGIRPAGWYLSLRWLGKEYTAGDSLWQAYFYNYYPPKKEVIETFDDPANINPDITLDEGIEIIYGKARVVNNTNSDTIKYLKWNNLNNIKKIKVRFRFAGDKASPDAHHHLAIELVEYNGDAQKVTRLAEYSMRDYGLNIDIEKTLDLNKFSPSKSFTLQFVFVVPEPVVVTVVSIKEIVLFCAETILVGKYFNGERALLLNSEVNDKLRIACSLHDEPLKFYIYQNLDYRISEYEVYIKSSVDNLYYKKLVYKIDGNWNTYGGYYYNTSPEVIEEPEETLNFNYGLGEIFVDKDFEIYSEAVLTGRVYAVTNSYLVRISHLAGSGKIQPDSFPYDLDKKVGYIEDLKSSVIKAVISLNENNIALISDKGIAVFSSFANRGVNIKQLRLALNTFSGFNPKSLTKSLTGNSSTVGIFLTSKEGIWYYEGSSNSLPQNLVFQQLFNYWQDAKKDGVGFFVKELDEYWYEYSNTEFLVYEASFKSFRLVTKPAIDIKGVFEYPDGSIGVYSSSAVYSWKLKNNFYYPSAFITHKNNLESEFYNKILQSIEVSLKKEFYETLPTFSYTLYVYADSEAYQFQFSTAEERQIRLFPLSVRCKEVIIVVAFPPGSYKNAVSEIILRYTVDGVMRDIHSIKEHLTITLPSGYGRDYGRSYIIM